MNISSNTASTVHQHKFKLLQTWGPYQLKDDYYIREKERWNSCRECGLRNQLKAFERESYGHRQVLGQIQDILALELIPIGKKIMQDLYKSGQAKRWGNFRIRLLKETDFVLIDRTIEELHRFGVLKLHFVKDRTRIDYWHISKIQLNIELIDKIEVFIGMKKTKKPLWIDHPFANIDIDPLTETGKQLKQILDEQKEMYVKSGQAILHSKDGQVLASSFRRGKKKYFLLLRALHGILHLVEEKRTAYLRTFSQEFFGDTKVFTREDMRVLQVMLPYDLTTLGLLSGRDEILVSGNFKWILNGVEGDSRAFKDYILFPRSMVTGMEITFWQPARLFIVENQDLFLDLLSRDFLNKEQWSVLFGGGFLGTEEFEMIKKAYHRGLKEIYIWPDIDPAGIRIAYDVKKKLKKLGVNLPVFLFGFDKILYYKLPTYKELSLENKREIELLLKEDIPVQVKELLEIMYHRGHKGEQEIMINYIDREYFGEEIRGEVVEL